ncbi:MAG: trigger factor [Oscillospiraceae bacterium]|nr:trigger factor [Oscillospiraceae bacterium]
MSLVSANKTETNTYSVEISVSAEDFKAAIQKAYLKQRKSISIPGFRKGKAPLHMIEKLYGKEVFYEDALDIVFPETVQAAYDEAGIIPVDQPKDFDVKTMSAEEGVVMTFNVTVKPEITLKAYKGLTAEKTEAKVTKEEVDHEIEHMLDRGSRIVDVDDRPVKDGDITVIDFEGFVDGVPFEGGKAEKYSLTIGSGSFIPGFEDQIIGHSIGDEFDVNVTFPADYAPELASKDAVFKIKLHEIQVKELPELDDEFAKDMGEYETVDELKKGVEEDILKRKQDSAQHAFEDAVIEALCENVEGEIPECMYDNKAKENVDSFAQRIAQQGIDLDTYLMYMGMDKATFEGQMRERAVNDVKLELAIEKIVELESVKASDEAVAEEYTKMADMYQLDVEKIKSLVPEATIAAEIARQDAIKLVLDSAKAKKPAAKRATKKKEAPAEEAEEKPAEEATAEKKPAAKKTTKKKEQPAE